MLCAHSRLSLLFGGKKGKRNSVESAPFCKQSIANNVDPERLAPDWEHLSETLRSAVQRQPGSDLARLSDRAAVRVDIALPSFGLVSHPPELWFGAHELWSFDRRVIYLIDIEASLDNLPWTPIGSIVVRRDPGRTEGGTSPVELGRIFSNLSPLPHRIDFRAIYSVLDAIVVSPSAVSDVFESKSEHDVRTSLAIDFWL